MIRIISSCFVWAGPRFISTSDTAFVYPTAEQGHEGGGRMRRGHREGRVCVPNRCGAGLRWIGGRCIR